MSSANEHWNAIFATKADPELGWYESDPSQTLKFLDRLPATETATVFLPGAGTSILVDSLLERCARLVLDDVSDEALRKLEARIGTREGRIVWLHHDMSRPVPAGLPPIDLWIDRAVLHFLRDEADIGTYFDNLRTLVRPGGHVLLAEFAPDGAPRCAGLEVHRYSVEELTGRLGGEFNLVASEHHVFVNPFGDPRPYVYALYRRDPC